MTSQDNTAGELIEKAGKCLAKRQGYWDGHWQDIASYILPSSYGAFFGQIHNTPVPKLSNIVDSTAMLALSRAASVVESMNTPRNQKWHHLSTDNQDVLKDRASMLYLEEVSKKLFHYRYLPKANFASQTGEVYLSFCAFGQGILFTDEDEEGGIRYRSIPLGHISFDVNHQNVVDTAYRQIWMSARAAMQKWGDALSDYTKGIAKKDPDQVCEFLHCVKPRDDYQPDAKTKEGKKFVSYYIDVKGKNVLQEGGYTSFPYHIPRYMTVPGSTYAFGMGSLALSAIKTLNEQKRTVLKQGHRIVDPVLLAHDDGILDGFSLKSGAINYGAMSADGKRLVDVLPTGNLTVGQEMMKDERQVINDIFLVTIFQILIETPEMTATEVMKRAEEKASLLSPIMGRIQSEMLDPMIEREVDILSSQNKLPQIPGLLKEMGGLYSIRYDSPLSRMQKAEEAAGSMRTLQWAAEIGAQTQKPEVFDYFNFDNMIPAMAEINAMPPSFINDKDTVEASRQNRNNQAQVQQMIDAAPGMASMMKAVQP